MDQPGPPSPRDRSADARRRSLAGRAIAVVVIGFVVSLIVFGERAGRDTTDGAAAPTTGADPGDGADGADHATATAEAGATPTTPPTAPNGIEFSDYPFVNDNGTYFSTLGAPPEYTAWIRSDRLLWNQPLPDDTPAIPNSAEIAAQIDQTVAGERFVDYSSALETGANAPYLLLVDSAREDFVRIESDCFGFPYNGWGWDDVAFEDYINNIYPGRDGVPLPADFRMDGDDADFAVTIYDYREDILIDFWVFKSSNLTGGAPTACWAGVIKDYATASDGVFPYPVGGSASGLTAAGTIITLEDLRQGSIDHALSVSTLQIYNEMHLDDSRPSASWPANRNDGVCAREPKEGWDTELYNRVMAGVENVDNCLREGQRLRLPAGLDLSDIEHPVARMVAEAMRDYGIIVHDYGGCFCIQGESGRVVEQNGFGSDPWNEAYAETPDWEVMQEIPWHLLEVLPTDWGKPEGYQRPCISTYVWIDSDPACERPVDPYLAG